MAITKHNRNGNNNRNNNHGTKPDWYNTAPADPNQTDEFDNRIWYWCPKCSTNGKWLCTHKPEQHQYSFTKKRKTDDQTGRQRPSPTPPYNNIVTPAFANNASCEIGKSLYDIKQAARTWFHYLEPGLTKLGFVPSQVDPCLFYRHDCIIAFYVDDCLLFSPDATVIDEIINSLGRQYVIGDKSSIQDFVCVHIAHDSTGGIQFSRPALVTSILQDLNLQDCHRKFTPAIFVLHPDHGGQPRIEAWNYHSVVGKLNYLAQMTHPDISMAAHNYARFSINPTYSHKQAIKCIGRYLAATQDKGLHFRPTDMSTLDRYVDADFAGA